MSLNASKFAIISFHFLFRIELFQRVAREKNKKIASSIGLAPQVVGQRFKPPRLLSSRLFFGERERDSANRNA
jgi:hypothetical protein